MLGGKAAVLHYCITAALPGLAMSPATFRQDTFKVM